MAPDQLATQRTGSATKTGLGLALLGLGVSLYLTIEHYASSVVLACPESAAINCAKVTTSQWSRVMGIPVALLGLGYFIAMCCLLLPAAWGHRALDSLRIGGGGVGAAMVLYLVWIELFRVNAICLWCTAVHACTIGLLAMILWHTNTLRWRLDQSAPTARLDGF